MLFFCSDPILSLFTSDGAVLKLGKTILLLDLVVEAGRSINNVLVRSLQAAGDVKYPTQLAILTMWVGSVFGGWLVGVHFSYALVGIWIAIALDECLRAILLRLRMKSGKWRMRANDTQLV